MGHPLQTTLFDQSSSGLGLKSQCESKIKFTSKHFRPKAGLLIGGMSPVKQWVGHLGFFGDGLVLC